MPVELRKRKAPLAPPVEPPAKKQSKVAKAATKVKKAVKGKTDGEGAKTNGPSKAKAGKVAQGDVITLSDFGGEVETHDGSKTTLQKLVEESKAGVVLFTYPKASTPGCTTQACLFRDSYKPLTKDGLAIYGLSTDSPKANTNFKEKQKLSYPLLCDPAAKLIAAIGFKKHPKGTQRGVFVVDKNGKVLLAEPGGPATTVDAVKKLVEGGLLVVDGEGKGGEKEEMKEKVNGGAEENAVKDGGRKKEEEEEEEEEEEDEDEEEKDAA